MKQQHQPHDDCEDCIREKKQNHALISIYQNLQSIKNRTMKTKQSVDYHMTQSFTNSLKLNQLSNQLNTVPNRTYQPMDQLAFQIAQQIAEASSKLTIYNQKLKSIISNHKKHPPPQQMSQRYKKKHINYNLINNDKSKVQKQITLSRSSHLQQPNNKTNLNTQLLSQLNLWLYQNPVHQKYQEQLIKNVNHQQKNKKVQLHQLQRRGRVLPVLNVSKKID